MAKYFIYDKSGNKRKDNNGNDVVVKKLTWSNKLMGEETVVVSVSSPCIINWAIGDYIMYRDHKYVLSTTPSVQKQARVSTVNNAIVYDSIKFSSLAGDEMTRCEFRDEVLGDDVHYNFASRKFTFYCNSLIDFANRVKANIVRVNSAWRVFTLCSNNGVQYYYESGIDLTTNGQIAPDGNARPISLTSNHGHAVGKKNQVVSISDQRVWDALQNVKDVFDVNFVVIDRNIFLGANGNVLGQNFRYGYGKGLFKFERNADDSQAVVTRLRAYGNSKNMPTRYYQNVGKRAYVDMNTFSSIDANIQAGSIRMYIPKSDSYKYVFNSKITPQNISIFEAKFNDYSGTFEYFYQEGDDNLDFISFVVGSYSGNTQEILTALNSSLQTSSRPRLYITSGVNVDKWYTAYVESDPNCKIPNNMAVENLMLPGFGFEGNSLYKEVQKVYTRNNDADKNLIAKLGYNTFEELCQHYNFSDDYSDPYIEPLPQINAYGLREESITFDGSGDEEDIFPSIEYVMGVDANGETLAKVAGSQLNVVDNGIVADENTDKSSIMYFYITLPNIGDFNTNDYLSTSSPTISMLDGMCGGMEFEIVDFGTKNEDGTRTIKCKRQQSDSIKDLYFPYRSSKDESASFMIKQGDRFSLLNMELPDVYVDGTALYALLPLAIEFLDKNRDMRFKYSLTVDNIHLARQHDDVLNAIEENKSYNGHKASKNDSVYWMMKAGDLVMFGDEDLGVNVDPENPDEITGSVLIESVEIKENESRLPQVNIQLVDEVSVGTLQAIQKQIDGIVKGTITVGSAASGGGGGYSAADIQRMVKTYGSTFFISKQNDDYADGNINFKSGVNINANESSGIALNFGNSLVEGDSGAGVWHDEGGWHIQADYLFVGKKIQAKEVEIQEERHIGGATISTAVGCVLSSVEDGYRTVTFLDSNLTRTRCYAKRCYFHATDGDKTISNDWKMLDQARCSTFNLVKNDESGYYENRYYWRLVVGTGSSEMVQEGASEDTEPIKVHYIDLYYADYTGSDFEEGEQVEDLSGVSLTVDSAYCDVFGTDLPQQDDDVFLLGCQNRQEPDRANAIVEAGAGSGSPYHRQYYGITTFELPTPRIDLNPKHPTLSVDSLTVKNSSGETIDVTEGLEALGDTIQMIQEQEDGTFIIHHLDRELVSGEDGPYAFFAQDAENLPSAQWVDDLNGAIATVDTSMLEHVGDFALTPSGLCYQFLRSALIPLELQTAPEGTTDNSDIVPSNNFVWAIVSDKYLIDAVNKADAARREVDKVVNQLKDIASDKVITAQEKQTVKREWEYVKQQYSGIVDRWSNIATASGLSVESIAYNNVKKAYNGLKTIMDAVLTSMSSDTTLVNDNGQLLVYYTDQLASGMQVKIGFTDAWIKWYDYYNILDIAVSSSLKNYVDRSIQAAQFENAGQIAQDIADKVSQMYIKLEFDENGSAFVDSIAAGLTTITQWRQSMEPGEDDRTTILTVTGSGIIETATYSSLFATAMTEYGVMTTASMTAYVTKNEFNQWESGLTFSADKIDFSSGTFTIDASHINFTGQEISLEGSELVNLSAENVTIQNGNVFKITAASETTQPTIEIHTNGLDLDASGNAKFKGEVEATSGKFSGEVNATSGTFEESCQFKGKISTKDAHFYGNITYGLTIDTNITSSTMNGDTIQVVPGLNAAMVSGQTKVLSLPDVSNDISFIGRRIRVCHISSIDGFNDVKVNINGGDTIHGILAETYSNEDANEEATIRKVAAKSITFSDGVIEFSCLNCATPQSSDNHGVWCVSFIQAAEYTISENA